MNKIYKVLFNHASGTWVAACETARSRGKGGRSALVAGAAAVLTGVAGMPANAGGDGGFGGSATDPLFVGPNWSAGSVSGAGGRGGDGDSAGSPSGGAGGAAPAALGATIDSNRTGNAGAIGTNATFDGAGGGGGGGDGGVAGAAVSVSGQIRGGAGGKGGNIFSGKSGAGGGGGAGLLVVIPGLGIDTTATGLIGGGTGGAGGSGGTAGLGGNGGAGGAGLAATGANTSVVNQGSITGGTGGAGGIGVLGGNGGRGGSGATVTGDGFSITNTGGITGGTGGALAAADGSSGAGGVGLRLTGSNGTLISAGTIAGGLAGNGGPRANAVEITGNGNLLELRGGYAFSGNVLVLGGGGNTLALGGSVDAAFDVSGLNGTGQFQGFSNFAKYGASQWSLTGTTSAITAWNVTAGTLRIHADQALGASSGGLTLDGGSLGTGATFSSSRGITLGAAGGGIATDTGTTFTAGGVVAGAGALGKTGGGTLVLGGANTYLGGTSVSGGRLVITSDASLGNAAGNLALDNGTLQTNASFSSARAITLGAAGGSFAPDSGTTLTLSSSVTGSGMLGQSGTGELVLGASNNYSGGTLVSAGSLRASAGSFGGGNITNNATLALDQAVAGTLANAIDGSGSLTKLGAGELTLAGANSYSGGTTISAGSLRAGTGSLGSAGISNNAALVIDEATNGTLVNAVTGTGSLTKAGAGTTTLGGTNSYSGGTTVLAGALVAGSATAFVQNSAYTVDGGTLHLNDHDLTMSSLAGAGGALALGTATLTVDQSTTTAYAGDIGGSGALVKSGSGTLSLGGASSYSGGTRLQDGVLRLTHNSALVLNGAYTVDGGMLDLSGIVGSMSSLAGTGGQVLLDTGAALTLDQSTNTTYAGALTGTGAVTKAGTGTLTLGGSTTLVGGLDLQQGRLVVGSAASLGSALAFGGAGTGVLEASTSFASSALVSLAAAGSIVAGSGVTLELAGTVQGAGVLTKSGGGTLLLSGNGNTYSGGTVVSAGVLRGDADSFGTGSITNQSSLLLDQSGSGTLANAITGSGSLTKLGAGTTTLGGNNTSSGTTTVSAGTLQAGSATGLAQGTAYVVDGGMLDLNGHALAVSSLSGTGGTLSLGSGAALAVNQTTNTHFAGAMSGTGSLTKSGAGELLLAGSSSYSGGTTVSAGTLKAGNASALSQNTAYTIDGGTLDLDGHALNMSMLSGQGGVVALGSALLTVTQDGDSGFAGAIAGTGALAKAGAGRLTLTGSNSYGGGTTIMAGSLQGDADSFGAGAITNNARLMLDQASTATLTNSVAGTGNLTKLGAGELTLAGANSYSGGTAITAGSLRGDASRFGSGAIDNDASLVLDQAGAATLTNNVSGSGSLTKLGAGELTLAGANSYSGGTTITAGSLRGDASRFGSGAIDNDASLVLDQAGAATLANNVSGSGSLTKLGAGELTLAGANSYSGGTTITAGSLRGDASRFGSGAITNNAALVLDQATAASLANAVDGSGSLAKLGVGELTLSGSNSYSGGTTISAGSLRGDASRFGSGAITNNAALVLDQATAATLANAISGTGFLTKLGTGELTLSGINTFTGGSTINGGSLRGAASGFGSGAITNNAALVLDQATAASLANAISGTGSLTKLGTGELTLSGINTFTGGSTISGGSLRGAASGFGDGVITNNAALVLDQATAASLANTITGVGQVTKLGVGELTLSGTNSYAGGTTISLGSLRGNAASFGSAQIVNNATLVLDQATQATLTNRVSGSGGLNKTGAGTLVLGAANDYSGGTTISAGTLQGAAASLGSGAVTNNANLVLDQADTATLANAIEGSGSLAKLGAGELTLSGANSYSGGTTITAGSLRGDASRFGGGSIANNAALVLDQASDAALGNSVSGSGSLTKLGTGELTLAGANSYSGGTTIAAGSLRGDASRFGSGTITTNASLVLDEGGTATLANTVAGTGSLTKEGAGALTLTGANSYSGGTTVHAGRLIAGNAGALPSNSTYTLQGGTLELNGFDLSMSRLAGTGGTLAVGAGTLTLEQASNSSFAGALTGTGTLVKAGAGALDYTGNGSAFNGTTQVNGGTLSVNGSLGGALSVNAGGMLKGDGTLGTVTVATGARVAPGNSIGILNVAGNLAFGAGSTYEVEVNAAGASDQLLVTGSATLTGGSVAVLPEPGSYVAITNYTILTAGGGIIGSFAGVTSNLAFLDPTLSYDANNAFLRLTRNNIDFVAIGTTRNQQQSAAALQALGAGNTLHDAIVPLDVATARSAFDQLAGEVHASVFSALLQDSHFVRDAGLDRLRQAQAGIGGGMQPTTRTDENGGVAWGRLFGASGRMDGDGNAARGKQSIGGVLVGADQNLGAWRVGVMGGASRSDQDIAARSATGRIDSYHLGLYGATRSGALALRGGASYTLHDIDTMRSVVFPGVVDNLRANYRAHGMQLFGELGWRMESAMGVALEPFANLAWVNLRNKATTEAGGVAALGLASGSNQNAVLTLGMRAATTLSTGNTRTSARGMLGWRHVAGDRSPQANMAVGGAGRFNVTGVSMASHAAVLEAGLDMALRPNMTLAVSYAGQLSGSFKEHSLRAALAWEF